MSIRNLLLAAGLVLACCLYGCASVSDVEDYSAKVDPGKGILVVSVDTMLPFSDLRITRPDDTFAAIVAKDLPLGRSIRFVEVPAGEYEWVRVDLGTFYNTRHYVALDKSKENRYKFTVKPGVVNYPGDFHLAVDDRELAQLVQANRVAFIYAFFNHYYIQLVDRTSMMVGDLTPDQKGMIARLGLQYTGPGADEFPSYYRSLTEH